MASNRMTPTDWRLFYEARLRAAKLAAEAARASAEAARIKNDESSDIDMKFWTGLAESYDNLIPFYEGSLREVA